LSQNETSDLGFNMERFLRNNEIYHPMLEATDEGKEEPGVLMERFLNDPVVVMPPSQVQENSIMHVDSITESVTTIHPTFVGQRSVSFDVAATSTGPLASFGYDMGTNASLVSSNSAHGDTVEIDSVRADDDIAGHTLMTPSLDGHDVTSDASDGIAFDEPRVLRLTEADMQEMAAIEEASIGNAPPSERDEELSEIGELADFGGGHNQLATDNTAFSQDTPTTAMESASQISDGMGYQSSRIAIENAHRLAATSPLIGGHDDASTGQGSVDHVPIDSIQPQLLLSPGAISNHSVAVNPPSVVAAEEDHTTELALGETDVGPNLNSLEPAELDIGERIELRNLEAEAIAERLRRSGFSPLEHPVLPLLGASVEVRPVTSLVDLIENTPMHLRAPHTGPKNYRSIGDSYAHNRISLNSENGGDMSNNERQRLLPAEIPYEVNTDICLKRNSDFRSSLVQSSSIRSTESGRRFQSFISWDGKKRRMSIDSDVADAVFHNIGSLAEDEEAHNDSEIYMKSNMFKRGKLSQAPCVFICCFTDSTFVRKHFLNARLP
jgi:hypothetical protein